MKNVIFVTGSDARFFLQLLVVLESFARHVPDARLVVCDFGLTPSQRRFLESRGVERLARPPRRSRRARHYFHEKAALYEFVKHRRFRWLVWIDADAMIVGDLGAAVRAEIAAMERTGAVMALAPDSQPTLGAFLDRWRDDADVGFFARTLTQHRISLRKPYFNSGFFICGSSALLKRYWALTRGQRPSFNFEQCTLNVVVHRASGAPTRILDPRVFNAHGELLERVTAENERFICGSKYAVVLHPAGNPFVDTQVAPSLMPGQMVRLRSYPTVLPFRVQTQFLESALRRWLSTS